MQSQHKKYPKAVLNILKSCVLQLGSQTTPWKPSMQLLCIMCITLLVVVFWECDIFRLFQLKHVSLLVNPPETYSHTQLCALMSMGLLAGRTRWPPDIASRPVFHWFTIRSALPKRLKAWSYLIWGRTNSCSDISPAGAGSHLSLVAVPCILGSFGENTHWKSKHSDSCCLFWLLFQWPWRDMVILSISGCLLCNAL